MTFTTSEEVKREILSACAASTDADNLRHLVFDSGQLLEQYLQFTPIDYNDLRELINQVDQRFQDLRFDEFKDEEFANWKRVRASVEHENTLVNHRLSWLFSSQAFLFTAFILVFNAWKSGGKDLATVSHFPYLLSIISIVGILICLSIQRGLNSAEDQLRALDKWWHRGAWDSQLNQHSVWKTRQERDLALRLKLLKHPPLQGFIRYAWWDRLFTYSVVPAFFLVAWALIFILIIFDLSSLVITILNKQGLLILSYIIFGIVLLVLRELIDRIRKNP
jgi:hypothetical protein